jgi:hypothetical protein
VQCLAFLLCDSIGDDYVPLIGQPIHGSFVFSAGESFWIGIFVQLAFATDDPEGEHKVEIVLEARDGSEAHVIQERPLRLWRQGDLNVERIVDVAFEIRFAPSEDVEATLALEVNGERLAHRPLDFRCFGLPDAPPL